MKWRINAARFIQLGVVAAVLLSAPLLRPAEPVHQGKRLSEWLEVFSRVGLAEINHEAENAIVGIGTNALPFLVADLCSEDIPLQLKLEQWYNSWSPIKVQLKPAADRHGPAEKLGELKSQTFLDTLHGKSIAETKRRLLLRRFPRSQVQVPGR